jgi:hypothetical protein
MRQTGKELYRLLASDQGIASVKSKFLPCIPNGSALLRNHESRLDGNAPPPGALAMELRF